MQKVVQRLIYYRALTSTSVLQWVRIMERNAAAAKWAELFSSAKKRWWKTRKEEEEQQLNSYGSSELELSYTKNDTSASVLKKGTLSFHFHSCHLICLQTSFTCKSLHSSCYKQCLFGSLFYSITLKKKGF